MKKLYITLIVLISTICSVYGATITAIQNNGSWNSASTWDLGRIPKSNDTIVIPSNFTVIVSTWNILNGVQIKIYGALKLQAGRLSLYSTSEVIVYRGGSITGDAADYISIRGVQKFQGSYGTQTGGAIANASTGVAPNGFQPFSTMPVTFTGFYAKKAGIFVQLTWTTVEEFNNSHFDIQRSNDGRNWSKIAVVAAATSSSLVNQYAYTDKNAPSGTVYYRLKQVDKDGQAIFSTIKTLQSSKTAALAHIYVATKQTLAIEFNEQLAGKVIVRISAVNGHLLREQVFTAPAYRMLMNLPSATPGIYVVQVMREGKLATSRKLIL